MSGPAVGGCLEFGAIRTLLGCSSMLKRCNTTETEKRMAAKKNRICSWDLKAAPRKVCVQSKPPSA
ncbi:hypothetical protein EYF80_026007 [Liparis tanakae]|uniref:Uncharacterized protein n=1 Tax=Liparis tanakae TaxID=230148 RepID=A0A4Z2HET4_9TELE|nr:hypothetical protein EYF80_026007 [Liparis tanakae]